MLETKEGIAQFCFQKDGGLIKHCTSLDTWAFLYHRVFIGISIVAIENLSKEA